MKDRAKMIIIGATVAASAAVPAIASAGGNNEAANVESNDARSAASAVTPAIAPAAATKNDSAAINSSNEAEDATEDAAETDVPITGTDLEKASAAALAHVGEGRVTETEVGDEESYYEIEVTLDDGSQLDVQLDEQFNFVGSEDEGSGSDD